VRLTFKYLIALQTYNFMHTLLKIEALENGDISSRNFVKNVFMLNYFI